MSPFLIHRTFCAHIGLTCLFLATLISLGVCSNVKYLKIIVLHPLIWVGRTLSFCLAFFLCILGNGSGGNHFHIFTFSWALPSARELFAASSSMRWRPGCLHLFGLCLHDVTRVHIVSGAIQGAGKLGINIIVSFSFGVIFRRSHRLVWTIVWQRDLLVASNGLIGFLGCEVLPL